MGVFPKNESEKKNLSAALYRVLFFIIIIYLGQNGSHSLERSLHTLQLFLVNIHDLSQSLFS